jgi:8-oxo-dGTP pyrophosphatase MutT (NUDIX family)
MRFDEARERLTFVLDGPRPWPPSPAVLLLVFSDGRLRPRLTPSPSARPAAVLVLVYRDAAAEARLVLTERVAYDGHHGGEVSFPGGKAEPGDADAVATALREAGEEIGLDRGDVERTFSASLDEVFIPVSDFRITPVIAIADRPPVLAPNPAEVARILTPPLDAFLPGAPVEMVERTIGDWPIRYGGFRIDGLHVWGATARILGQLGAIVAGAA